MKLSILAAAAAFVMLVVCVGSAQALTDFTWKGKATATVDSYRMLTEYEDGMYDDYGPDIVDGTADVTLSGHYSWVAYPDNPALGRWEMTEVSFVDSTNGVRLDRMSFCDQYGTDLESDRLAVFSDEATASVNDRRLECCDVWLSLSKKGETQINVMEGDAPCETWKYTIAPGDYHGMFKAK